MSILEASRQVRQTILDEWIPESDDAEALRSAVGSRGQRLAYVEQLVSLIEIHRRAASELIEKVEHGGDPRHDATLMNLYSWHAKAISGLSMVIQDLTGALDDNRLPHVPVPPYVMGALAGVRHRRAHAPGRGSQDGRLGTAIGSSTKPQVSALALARLGVSTECQP